MRASSRSARSVAVLALATVALLVLMPFGIGAGSGAAAPHSARVGTLGGPNAPISAPAPPSGEAAGAVRSPARFDVTFNESGLPPGTSWGLSLNGTEYASTAGLAIVVALPNGSYAYAITDVPGWHQRTLAYSGTLSVNGTAVDEPTLLFSAFVLPVTFVPSGLLGVAYTVTFDGSSTSSDPTVPTVFDAPNGSYEFSVTPIPNWRLVPPSNYSGSITVAGDPVSIALAWARAVYPVLFDEVGLAHGTAWTVRFTSPGISDQPFENGSRAPDTIGFWAANGSFSFTVPSISGYLIDPDGGGGEMRASAQTVTIVFVPTYPATFEEHGLPNATIWGVTIDAVTGTSAYAPESVQLSLVLGLHNYTILPVPGYVTRWASTFAVTTGGSLIEVNFIPYTAPVTFHETGLATGTTWSVTVNGTTYRATSPDTIVTPLVNGSYAFSVASVADYGATPEGGSFVQAGPAGSIAISFVPTGWVSFGTGSSATFASLLIVGMLPVVGGVTYLARRRPHPPG